VKIYTCFLTKEYRFRTTLSSLGIPIHLPRRVDATAKVDASTVMQSQLKGLVRGSKTSARSDATP